MRFAVHLLALSAAVACIGAAPPPDPLAALAALAAANGHPAAVHFHATGERVVEGRTVTTSVDQLGQTRLIRRCVAGVCGGAWFDGSREWTFGLNEVALPEANDVRTLDLRTLSAIASCAFAEPAFRAAGGTVAPAGPNRWLVRARDGLALVAVTDATGRRLVGVETPAGEPVASYGRPAAAGGATFALDRAGPLESGPLDAVAVAPGPLGPPPGPVPSFGPPSLLPLAAATVPVVPCSLGGHAWRCLLDSGATPSAVNLNVAEALDLEPRGELELSGFSAFATGFIETGPLALGGARFTQARFAVVPPSMAAPFDVVVGSDLLGRLRIVLDRRKGTAEIEAPGGPPGANAVPLTFRSGSPYLPLQLGPQGLGALLDTGDDATVSLGYAQYREGPQWPVVARGSAAGIAGAEDAFVVEVPDVRVGTFALGATRAVVRRTQATPHVGVGLWSREQIELDEQAERISFGGL